MTQAAVNATVRHYTYEASQHCPFHAEERFGAEALATGTAEDSEGNPVGACFTWDECDDDSCDECVYEEATARWASEHIGSGHRCNNCQRFAYVPNDGCDMCGWRD